MWKIGSNIFPLWPVKWGRIYTFAAMAKLHNLYLLTGSNLGDRIRNLGTAASMVEDHIGEVLKVSSYYETEPWGNVDQPPYINQAMKVLTPWRPAEVLKRIWNIEGELGRKRRNKWEARCIDIDILFYDHHVIDQPDLKVPHPLLHKRNFALIPMLEIAPKKRHPVFRKTIEQLYMESGDTLEVILLDAPLMSP